MAQPETVLVNLIRKRIKMEFPNAFVVKLAGGLYQAAGLPDLLVIHKGRAYGFEVKRQRPGETAEHARERATLRQRATLDKFQRAGAHASVVLDADEVLAKLRGDYCR